MQDVRSAAPIASRFHTYPSTYIGIVIWVSSGFMSQPTFASFIVHFLMIPPLLLCLIWMARWEAKRDLD